MDGQPQLQPQQPLGLGIFELDDSITGGGASRAQGSKAAGNKKKKSDDDDTTYTTIMLRNIPNKYTRQMLIDQLHRNGFTGDIDYLYLPTDFANRCNVGYCFVNFRESTARARFVTAFDGSPAQSCLPGFNSYKICQVTRAKWQGREDNVRRLKSSPDLMAQLAAHTEWLPLLLDAEGNSEPFVCDDVAAARGPAAPRRQMRKKNQGMMVPGYEGVDMAQWAAASAFHFGGGMVDESAMGGYAMGRGRGGGDRGKRKGRGGASHQDMAMAVPTMMSVPVMTEQGLQYIPYDAYTSSLENAYEGGGMMAMMYSPMSPEMYGMMPGGYGSSGYPAGWWGADGSGFPEYGTAAGVWPRPPDAKGAGRGGGRKNRPQAQDESEDA